MKAAYKFSRGDQYSVDVLVAEDDSITYGEIKMPENAPQDCVEQLLDEAEVAVLKQILKKE